MTEPTTCCHTHDIMDVAAAVVTPGVDVARLMAERDELQKQVDGMREEGCAAIGALENIFTGATSPEEIKGGDPTVQKIAAIASEVLATAKHCDHKAQLAEAVRLLRKMRKAILQKDGLAALPHIAECICHKCAAIAAARAFLVRQAEEPSLS